MMDGGTPRLRSAFPATPQTHPPNDWQSERYRRGRGGGGGGGGRPLPPRFGRLNERMAAVPPIQRPLSSSTPSDALIPEHIVDAPSQRLYAVTIWFALWGLKAYDFYTLAESEEQSLWLFMKWVAIDAIWLFSLPNLRIPWLKWSSATMTLLFCAHAFADGMLMFRVPVPVGAGLAALGRSIWGAYELAVNENRVNPRTIEFNESLILGRQIIHVLPEGSAILNPEREAFCLGSERIEARLPIMINATNPTSMDILRVDLETPTNETIHISKSQIKAMHKEASRLLSYSENPNEPKILYYAVKKPGLYHLEKVVDESNLEVTRKRVAHTVVVPCPKAAVIPSGPERCRGELSNVEFEVTGTPPMRIKYRKLVNQVAQESTFDSIQPEDFVSPLARINQNALAVPNRVETAWAKPQKVRVPLSESLGTAGRWVYSISEVQDGFGNTVSYSARDHEDQERHLTKSSHLHQVITVHERPTVNLLGCTPQNPLKVARGALAPLPVQYGSSGRGAIADTPHNLAYTFTPQADLSATGQHSSRPQLRETTVKNVKQRPVIQDAGLYTITGVSTDVCHGDVLEPASCLLQNPPEPQLTIRDEEIFDKCAGSPIGLRVDLDLIGTPPFEVRYTMTKRGDRHHMTETERVPGLRAQIELTPRQAGEYDYEFVEISDAVYKNQKLPSTHLRQSVKPAASAHFVSGQDNRATCIDEITAFDVALQGEGPFSIEWELVHGGKRAQHVISGITENHVELKTGQLRDGGDYTLALVSITDRMGCKEFLKDEVKIAVRHQKPRAGFGLIEGSRHVDTLEGKSVLLPLRLAGEGPWTVKYVDKNGRQHEAKPQQPNDAITVDEEGTYELVDVKDAFCPGAIDDAAKIFDVSWIPRPQLRIPENEIAQRNGHSLVKADVCEGDEDAVEIVFKGSPPYHVQYVETIKPEHGVIAPKNKELRAAVNVASLRMDTAQAGLYEYKFMKLEDSNYAHSAKDFPAITLQQRVSPRPSVAFTNPGKTYSYCSVESDGEELIPITLHGAPPFQVEVEIKHHSTARPELLTVAGIPALTHHIRIPHARLHPGRSAISLRRVSDSKTCSRLLDSTTPRVHVSVHDAPSLRPLESNTDYCVGERINFALAGVAPFSVFYTFEGARRKAVVRDTTLRRLAEKPGVFVITGVQDSASSCKASMNVTKHIHGMPSVRVSHGRENSVEIHEGGEAEILFEFGGSPPFEFTYTRSSNADRDKRGGKKGVVLDARQEVSQEHSMRIRASEEGTYEVVAIKDRYCSYVKPGSHLPDTREQQKRLKD